MENIRKKFLINRDTSLIRGATAFFIVLCFIYFFVIDDIQAENWKLGMSFWGVLASTIVLCIAYKKFDDFRVFRLSLIMAYIIYLFADVFWFKGMVIDQIEILSSHPSIVLYILNNFFLAVSVVLLIKERIKDWNNTRLIIDAFLVVGLVYVIIWIIFSNEIENAYAIIEYEKLDLFVDFIYIITNFTSILTLSTFAYIEKSQKGKNNIKAIIMGYTLFFMADLVYIYLNLNQVYYADRFVDVIWPLALVIIAGASFKKIETVKTFEVHSDDMENVINKKEIKYDKTAIILITFLSIVVLLMARDILALIVIIPIIAFRILLSKHITVNNSNQVLNNKYEDSNVRVLEINRKLVEINQRLNQLANFDPLTNTYNRRRLIEEIERLIKTSNEDSKFAILFIDIDRFKHINDNYGHDFGDLVLRETAKRLSNVIGKNDIISRQGGDEFVIVLDEYGDTAKVEQICNKVVEEMKREYKLSKRVINTSASVGVVLYPDDATSLELLYKYADLALYKSKNSGKGKFIFFDSYLKATEERRLDLENQMYKGIKGNEFYVEYQPQVNSYTREIIGMEALLRWNNTELGTVNPGEFIPIAEENGLILELGNFVLNKAICDIKTINNKYNTDYKVGINVSLKQFYSDDFVELLKDRIKFYGIKPSWVGIEITESFMENSEITFIEKLEEIKSLGVSISIDDFGTGYSSLAYLKNYPVDYLKIDMEFIKGIVNNTQDLKIVKAIISMCKELGIKTVAEGVETIQQYNILKKFRCDYIQGYYFSKPTSLETIEKEFILDQEDEESV